MNVLEMHIATKQAVDRINAERADALLPEEMDLELNKAMMRFINQRYGKNNVYRKGFEESQKRIDELRSLLTEYEDGVSFKEELRNNKIWVDTFQLPSNYMYLVNQRSTVCLNRCKHIPFNLEPVPILYYFTFSLEDLLVNNGAFVDSVRMQNDVFGSTTYSVMAPLWEPSPELLSAGYTSAGYPQYSQQVIADLIENAPVGFAVYWESFGPLSHPGQLIVTVDRNIFPWFEWDGSIEIPTPLVGLSGTTQITTSVPRANDSGLKRRVPIEVNVTKDQFLNRFSQQDDIFKLLDDPLNTTIHTEPLTTIRGNNIDIYTNDIFLIDRVKITYLRKPKPISLSLGYDCELPEHTHQEIVAMAASSILEEITDPRYKTQQGEMLNRE
jgi:hypothetical protein